VLLLLHTPLPCLPASEELVAWVASSLIALAVLAVLVVMSVLMAMAVAVVVPVLLLPHSAHPLLLRLLLLRLQLPHILHLHQ